MKTILLLLPIAAFAAVHAEAPVVHGVLTFGGGRSAAGAITLNAALVPFAAEIAAGASFTVLPDPLNPGTVDSPPTGSTPLILIQSTTGGATLSWLPPATGYVLESAESLAPAAWSPVPNGGASPVEVAAEGTTRFFRLRRVP